MNKPDRVLIPIGDDSIWCRAMAITNELPTGASKRLKIQSLKDSLGEYLIVLLAQGYFLHLIDDDESGMTAIEALGTEYLLRVTEGATDG